MNYKIIEHLKESDFKRRTGVQRETFDQMFAVIKKGVQDFGRPAKLSRAEQLLMTLMYWREYRIEFCIAQYYSVSEDTVLRTIHKIVGSLVLSALMALTPRMVVPGNHLTPICFTALAFHSPILLPFWTLSSLLVLPPSVSDIL